jgi:signal transduction histidine kinase
MDESSPPHFPTAPGGYPHLIPILTATTGGVLLLVAAVQAITTAQSGAPPVVVALDSVFFGAPGATLVYTGFWMPRSDIGPEYYPRLVVWMLGGVAVMFGFIVLRDLHPAVSVDWATGTQAIALTIGSIGGLLIGIQETRTTLRTAQLRERTTALVARERELERKNDRLEEFASVISHDLRNPLNVAQGHLELAREGIESEHLDTVADSHDRMNRLIEVDTRAAG